MILLKASTRWLSLRVDLLSNFLVTSVSAGALFATQSPGKCYHLTDCGTVECLCNKIIISMIIKSDRLSILVDFMHLDHPGSVYFFLQYTF